VGAKASFIARRLLLSSPGWHGTVALDDLSATALMGGVEVGSIYSSILGCFEYFYVRLNFGLSCAVDNRIALYQKTSASHCHALLDLDEHATPVPQSLDTLMKGNAVASRYLIKYALRAGPSGFLTQTYLPDRIAVRGDWFLTQTLADRIALREKLRRSIHVDEYCMLSRSDIYVLVTRLHLIEAAIIVSM